MTCASHESQPELFLNKTSFSFFPLQSVQLHTVLSDIWYDEELF